MDDISIARNGVWVPTLAVITNMSDVFDYIYKDIALNLVSEVVNTQSLIEAVTWDNFYSKCSGAMEFLKDYEETIQDLFGLELSEIYAPLRDLEEYIHYSFLPTLPRKACDDFQENGFLIQTWLSDKQAIIESTNGIAYPSHDRPARRKNRFRQYVGYHPGYDRCHQ